MLLTSDMGNMAQLVRFPDDGRPILPMAQQAYLAVAPDYRLLVSLKAS
jgi:hypothetical protein